MICDLDLGGSADLAFGLVVAEMKMEMLTEYFNKTILQMHANVIINCLTVYQKYQNVSFFKEKSSHFDQAEFIKEFLMCY